MCFKNDPSEISEFRAEIEDQFRECVWRELFSHLQCEIVVAQLCSFDDSFVYPIVFSVLNFIILLQNCLYLEWGFKLSVY